MKRLWVDKNDDIIITDFSKTTEILVNYSDIKQPEVTTIEDELYQKIIFERFYFRHT